MSVGRALGMWMTLFETQVHSSVEMYKEGGESLVSMGPPPTHAFFPPLDGATCLSTSVCITDAP